jgi:WD40 repeat protein
MFSKKIVFVILFLLVQVYALYSQANTLNSKIKLDTTYRLGLDILALAPAGSNIAFGDENGNIYLIDSLHNILETPVKHTGWINSISNKGDSLLVNGSDGCITIFDVATNSVKQKIKVSDETIKQSDFISDSILLVLSDNLSLLNTKSGKITRTFPFTRDISCMALIPDRQRVILGFTDGSITIFDINTSKSITRLLKHKNKITAFAISKDRRQLLSGDATGIVTLWQLSDYSMKKSFQANDNEISSIAFSDDTKYFITAGWDKNIKVWNRTNFKLELNITAHTNIVSAILFHKDKLFTASYDNTIKVWNPREAGVDSLPLFQRVTKEQR